MTSSQNRAFYWPTTSFLINESKKKTLFSSRRRALSVEDQPTTSKTTSRNRVRHRSKSVSRVLDFYSDRKEEILDGDDRKQEMLDGNHEVSTLLRMRSSLSTDPSTFCMGCSSPIHENKHYHVTLPSTTCTTTSRSRGKQRSKSVSRVLDFYSDRKEEILDGNREVSTPLRIRSSSSPAPSIIRIGCSSSIRENKNYQVTLPPTTNATTSGSCSVQRSKSVSRILDFYLDGKQEMQDNNGGISTPPRMRASSSPDLSIICTGFSSSIHENKNNHDNLTTVLEGQKQINRRSPDKNEEINEQFDLVMPHLCSTSDIQGASTFHNAHENKALQVPHYYVQNRKCIQLTNDKDTPSNLLSTGHQPELKNLDMTNYSPTSHRKDFLSVLSCIPRFSNKHSKKTSKSQ